LSVTHYKTMILAIIHCNFFTLDCVTLYNNTNIMFNFLSDTKKHITTCIKVPIYFGSIWSLALIRNQVQLGFCAVHSNI
jgi:hypothetical protein